MAKVLGPSVRAVKDGTPLRPIQPVKEFGIIFLALFFVTISHVLCIDEDDIAHKKAIVIPFMEFPDGNNRVLLVTMNKKPEKGAMFVRGHVKIDEEADPMRTAQRETEEETGYKGKVVHTGNVFIAEHPTDDFNIEMHPYTVRIPAGSQPKTTIDTDGRTFSWVLPSEVRSRLKRPDMLEAWGQLGRLI